MMKVTYAWRWSLASKRPLRIWSEAKARRAHDQGKLYVALIGDDPNAPDCVLNVRFETGYVGVIFLDSYLRWYMGYSFVVRGERMFLNSAFSKQYLADTDQEVQMYRFYFKPGGSVVVENVDFLTETTSRTSGMTDVSNNWEEIPDFGDYASIAKKNRGIGIEEQGRLPGDWM